MNATEPSHIDPRAGTEHASASDVAEHRESGVPLRVARKGDLFRARVLLVGTLVLGAAILVTVFAFTKPKVIYSRTVSELVKKPLLETTVRVEGILVPESLCKGPAKCELRFRLTDRWHSTDESRNELEVRHEECVTPDTFRDVPGYELTVLVEGELRDDIRHFDATRIMTQCTGKYDTRRRAAMHEALTRPIPACR